MRQWIKISDERPPFMKMVIFYDGDNVWPGWDESNEKKGEGLSVICVDPAFLEDAFYPTHWMPLPEFPEE